MTESPESYGKALFQLGISNEYAMECKNLLLQSPELVEVLCSRLITKEEKHAVIDRIFQESITKFFKYICDRDNFDSIFAIFDEYEDCYLKSKNIAKATLYYVDMPENAQIAGIKKMLCRDLKKDDILLILKKDPSIIGGCVLSSGSYLYDKSVKGALEGLKRKLLWR